MGKVFCIERVYLLMMRFDHKAGETIHKNKTGVFFVTTSLDIGTSFE